MNIQVEFIPRDAMRCDSAGDYFEEGDTIRFIVAQSGNDEWDWLVLLHEMVEYVLVKKAGIPIAEIDAFDMAFQGDGEPGDDPSAPYRHAHSIATGVERIIAGSLGIDWKPYDEAVCP